MPGLAASRQALISCLSLSLAVTFLSEEGARVGSTLRNSVDFGMGKGLEPAP